MTAPRDRFRFAKAWEPKRALEAAVRYLRQFGKGGTLLETTGPDEATAVQVGAPACLFSQNHWHSTTEHQPVRPRCRQEQQLLPRGNLDLIRGGFVVRPAQAQG